MVDLLAAADRSDSGLEQPSSWIEDTGEVNWLVADALRMEAPVPVIASEGLSLDIHRGAEDRQSASDALPWRGELARRTPVTPWGTAVAAVHVQTLQRAAQVAGGVEMLASRLKVRPSRLRLWLQGRVTPPMDVFLRAVDLLTQDERVLQPPTRQSGSGNPGADLPS